MAKKTANSERRFDEKEVLSLMADPMIFPEPITSQTHTTVLPKTDDDPVQTVPDDSCEVKKAVHENLPNKRTQRENVEEYIRRFLSPSQPAVIRRGVYIDRELHTKISALVGVVGKRNLTVGSFVDAVLYLHFEQFRDEVKTVFSKRFNKIL